MSGPKVLVVGEGPADVGDEAVLGDHGTQTTRRIGAVKVLVRRILAASLGESADAPDIQTDRLGRIGRMHHAKGFSRKVHRTIQEAGTRGFSAVAIVIDRDRTPGVQRLQRLREGRDEATKEGIALAERTAVGVAVETVEAWLLSDVLALNKAFSPEPLADEPRSPESLDGPAQTDKHPKSVLGQVLRRATTGLKDPFAAVAEEIRLDIAEKRCAKSFAPFAKEVRQRCL